MGLQSIQLDAVTGIRLYRPSNILFVEFLFFLPSFFYFPSIPHIVNVILMFVSHFFHSALLRVFERSVTVERKTGTFIGGGGGFCRRPRELTSPPGPAFKIDSSSRRGSKMKP